MVSDHRVMIVQLLHLHDNKGGNLVIYTKPVLEVWAK